MSSATVLIVDDEKLIRFSVRERLQEDGQFVLEAATGEEALKQLERGADLVLLDLHLPDVNDLSLLEKIKQAAPETVVIMLTGDPTPEIVVEAMKCGAFHYVTKPVDLDELAMLVGHALETTRLKREVRALQSRAEEDGDGLDAIIGESPAMQKTKRLLAKVAQSPATTVLLTGETGTGKDLAARAIHYASERAAKPYMNITCTVLPDTLFDSELFGHEKGAFTDAKTQRKGLLEQANGGSVFLDEIAELPLNLQAKLLRFLEDKTLRRVGGSVDIEVDVRVIAATNRNLEEMVAEGSFREDLFYRLQVMPIELPPVRERGDDVVLLAQYFAERFGKRFGHNIQGLDESALERICTYRWPGNVREIRNAVERAVLLCDSERLAAADFDALKLGAGTSGTNASFGSGDGATTTQPQTVEQFQLPEDGIDLERLERHFVIQALSRTEGNQTRAAALLGINRDQIRYRIQKFDLDPNAL